MVIVLFFSVQNILNFICKKIFHDKQILESSFKNIIFAYLKICSDEEID